MTPVAHALVADLTLPTAKQKHVEITSLVRPLDDLHCFECTAVDAEARLLADDLIRRRPSGRLAFLPAPRTFLESAIPPPDMGFKRLAFLLEACDDVNRALVQSFLLRHDGAILRIGELFELPLGEAAELRQIVVSNNASEKAKYAAGSSAFALYALLAMINTPRVILRQIHQPHRGLQRQLRRAMGAELNVWHEIRLEVRPPTETQDSTDVPVFSGHRARHFVRCHLRIRLGALELVSAHWRGDPALGVRQASYSVVPPKDGVWPQDR
jgi:hypothetical protein